MKSIKIVTGSNMKNKEEIKKVISMAWPAVLESFFIAVVGLVDSLMVSRVGAFAVAAVGLTVQPKFIVLAIFIAMKVALSALVARRKGENNKKSANQILLMALIFTTIFGIVMSIFAVVFADYFIILSGSNSDTHDSAVMYFRIIMGSMIFMIISMVINGAQRGAGKTKIALRTNLVSNIINLIGNYLLIGGNFGFPALGVKGAAIATVTGTVVACGMSIASLFSENNFISITYMIKEKIKPAIEPMQKIIKIGLPIFVEQFLVRIGFMSVAIMAAKLGTGAFAAHQVGMNIMTITFAFGDGMQVAALALIGQSLGEGKPDDAKMYGKLCKQIGMIIAIILTVVYIIFGQSLFELFFTEEAIINQGIEILTVIIFIVILQIPQVIYMGCLRGAGDVVFTTIATTCSVTIVRPIASFILCHLVGWGMTGLWVGILIDQLLRFLLTSGRFKSGVWIKFKI